MSEEESLHIYLFTFMGFFSFFFGSAELLLPQALAIHLDKHN